MRAFGPLGVTFISLSCLSFSSSLGCTGGGGDASGGGESASLSATASSASAGETSTSSGASGGESEASTSATGMSASMGSTTRPGSTGETSAGTTGDTTTGGDAECPITQPPAYQGAINDACASEPQVGTFNPVVEWSKKDFTLSPGAVISLVAPVVLSVTDDNRDGKLDGDDTPDVLMTTVLGPFGAESKGVLRAIAGDGSVEHWAIADQDLYGQTGIAAGDLDGDGFPEIIASTIDHRVKCFGHDGALQWTSPSLAAEEIRADYPAISDMDHDGTPEVIVGRVILRGDDGSVRGIGDQGRGSAFVNAGRRFSTSFAVDADQDGVEEVIVGNAMYTADGVTIWQNGASDGFVAAGDFDGDGEAEVVVVASGKIRLQTNLGAILWEAAIPDAQSAGGPPTIADFDGDGAPEIGVAGRGAYVVFEGDGGVRWTKSVVDVSSGITGSSVYDFEGDGIADVVYADETTLWVFSGVDGAVKLAYTDHSSGTALEYPVIADVDNDGETEIVLVHNNVGAKKTHNGVTVIGDADHSWIPARRLWNQYAYFITNIGDDGAIPAAADANWTLYNNFRAGDPSPPDGLKSPDLVVEGVKCEAYCADDQQVFWVHLGNEGASPLTAGAVIDVYGVKDKVETLVQSLPWAGVLAPGEFTAGIFVGVDPIGYDAYIIRATAKETECKLDNNELTFEPPFCTIPG